jgi:hypothetical protein
VSPRDEDRPVSNMACSISVVTVTNQRIQKGRSYIDSMIMKTNIGCNKDNTNFGTKAKKR